MNHYYLRGSDGEGLGTLAPPVYEDCGFDVNCQARNNVKEQAYYQQLYAQLGVSDISSPGSVVSQRDPVTGAVLVPNSGNVQPAYGTPLGTPTVPQMQGQQGNTLTTLQNTPVPVTSAPTVPLAPLQSPGSSAGASSSSATTIGGFDLSSIPTWGWLAAAGVAAFFMFGKGGR